MLQFPKYFIVFLSVILLCLITVNISAQSSDQKRTDAENKIKEYEQKLVDIRKQKTSLASEIQYMDTQIYLTDLKATETQEKILSTQNEIQVISSRIEGLDSSLNSLSKLLLNRIVLHYKTPNVTMFDVLLNSSSASNLLSNLKYRKTVQDNNQQLLLQVQETKLTFEDQRKVRENKKVQLDELSVLLKQQEAALDVQKEQKQRLLTETKNDEATYQQLLTRARSEYEAIQGIVSGAGTETKLRDVTKGERIASIIPGASCNSSGGHLHFIVQEGSSVQNPFNYLKDVEHVDYAGDPWSPSGSWDWPINPSIQFNQGYGQTSCVRNGFCGRIYSSHNGIDINGSSSEVKAVADGTLYRGSYSVGCALPYMKLVHKDSNVTTLYLHVYSY